MTDTNINDHLVARIKVLESEKAKLEANVKRLEDELDGYKITEDENDGMPVPRLEIRWTKENPNGNWGRRVARYSLVYRHYLKNLVSIPLGMTTVTGPDEKPTTSDMPFRDGVHIIHDKEQLGLPAYVVVGKHYDIATLPDFKSNKSPVNADDASMDELCKVLRKIDDVLLYLSEDQCGPMLAIEDPESGVHEVISILKSIRSWCASKGLDVKPSRPSRELIELRKKSDFADHIMMSLKGVLEALKVESKVPKDARNRMFAIWMMMPPEKSSKILCGKGHPFWVAPDKKLGKCPVCNKKAFEILYGKAKNK